jgi:peptidoglycan/xylan/chitin deacetylase (PgdA/CDA1 family)
MRTIDDKELHSVPLVARDCKRELRLSAIKLECKRTAVLSISLGYYGVTCVTRKLRSFIGPLPPRLIILYYHGVSVNQRQAFAAQLDSLIASGATTVRADYSGPCRAGQWLVSLTFDDGFTGVFENAVPEMAKRNIPAVIFVPSGMLGRQPDWEMEPGCKHAAEKVVDGDSLRAADSESLVVGAHGVCHRRLPAIGRESAGYELTGSKSLLSSLLTKEINIFSFPYGEYNDEVVELCRTAGYKFAFTTIPAALDPTRPNFLRGRVSAEPTDWPIEFWLKIRGAYGWRAAVRPIRAWSRSLLGKARTASA